MVFRGFLSEESSRRRSNADGTSGTIRGTEHQGPGKEDGGPITTAGGVVVPPDEAIFLTPSLPTKIVCVGRNYKAHAAELGNPMPERPLLFLKPPSALLNPGGTILLPEDSGQVEYEGEIGVIIGRHCRNLSPSENPMNYVLGVTPLNDVTARDLQKMDVQFTRAKSFDTFCPMGPWCLSVEELRPALREERNWTEKRSRWGGLRTWRFRSRSSFLIFLRS